MKLKHFLLGFLLAFFLFGCIKPVENIVDISFLNQNLDSYLGEKVTVEGYLGHKAYHGSAGFHILIKDYNEFFIREPLPEYTYLLVDDGDAPLSTDFEGMKLKITGTINEYDGYSITRVAVITVEELEVIG
ncbi:hypothetical protein KAW38_02585 [Candidatus Micrarchaeota archaeon]|nr:hypothetical protein [Candidatus Micrarchaeota archaeon]